MDKSNNGEELGHWQHEVLPFPRALCHFSFPQSSPAVLKAPRLELVCARVVHYIVHGSVVSCHAETIPSTTWLWPEVECSNIAIILNTQHINVIVIECHPKHNQTRARLGSGPALARSSRIRIASVPSSISVSRNHGCFRASFAVMRFLGS